MSSKLILNLLTFFLVCLISACGSSGGSSDSNDSNDASVSGTILSYGGGEPIENAEVVIRYADQVLRASTNAQGEFSVETFTTSERVTLSADAEGFSEHSIIITPNLPLSDQLRVRLQVADLQEEFDAGLSQTFNEAFTNLNLLELPANALVDANGAAFEGTARVEITVIDPALDASTMPGDYRVQPEGDTSGILESFGAIAVTFESDQGELNLAGGQSATIRIPVSSLYDGDSAPETMPLFYFDDESGYWVEEGTATLVIDPVTNIPVYVGSVSHFTVWNADQIINTVTLTGRVLDSQGQPLGNAQIRSEGRDYNGQSYAYTNEYGEYAIQVRIDSELILYFAGDGQSQVLEWNSSDLTVTDVTLAPSEFTAKLTWGALPPDLDAHFITPLGEVYYSNDSVIENGFYALLDVDDTTAFGPEIISGSAFTEPGCYEYYVDYYSGNTHWDETEAKVTVDLNNEERTLHASQATGLMSDFEDLSKIWSVFTVEIDDDLNSTLTWTHELVDETHCGSEYYDGEQEEVGISESPVISFSSANTRERTQAHFIKRKYKK